jgi:hypothetical protein
MEWWWIVTGTLAGYVVASLATRYLPGGRRKAPGEPRSNEEWERYLKTLALDVEDGLEKMARLYDRLRKRAKIDHEETPADGARIFKSGADVTNYARQKGLTR